MSGGEWFHSSRTTIKRSEGRSVVAAVAYRTGSRLTCEREMTTHDYTRKQGVAEVFVTTPAGKEGVEWAQDIPRLANAMEASEKRKDAQLGHEWTIALPSDLDDPQRSALSQAMAQKLSDLYGVAVIGAIHRPGREGDERNHHVHLLFTTRQVEADGKLGAKVTVITDRKTSAEEVTRFRRIAAELINDALADAGRDERVSPLSFKARGIDQVPTTHLGPVASEMERRAPGSSDRADGNREITAYNQLVAELAALDVEIAAAEEQRLDARYGAAEPDRAAPQTAFDVALQPAIDALERSEPGNVSPPAEQSPRSFAVAIGSVIEALGWSQDAAEETRPAPDEPPLPSFDAAVRPAIVSLGDAGSASPSDARRWKRMMDSYRHGTDRLAQLGREALGSWQRFVQRTTPHGRDGPDR